MNEIRISWEMADPHEVNDVEIRYGKKCWQRLPTWPDMRWAPVERVTADEAEARDQFETLKAWADNREEPVRNVRLETRPTNEWQDAPDA